VRWRKRDHRDGRLEDFETYPNKSWGELTHMTHPRPNAPGLLLTDQEIAKEFQSGWISMPVMTVLGTARSDSIAVI
jgi:hypothetical protein